MPQTNQQTNNQPLWIFVDETGTSSLDDNSNPIFGLGFLTATDPVLISKIVSEVKYEIWREGKNNQTISQFFHAANDPKAVRNKFYQKILSKKLKFNNFSFYYLYKQELFQTIPEKQAKTKNFIQKDWLSNTYSFCLDSYFSSFLKFYLKQKPKFTEINFVLSSLFTKKESLILSKIFIKNMQKKLQKLGLNLEIKIYWVENKTDYCCQLADYFSWSVNRKIVKKEDVGYWFLQDKAHFTTKNLIHYLIERQKNTPPIGSSYSPENSISPS